MSYKEKYLKYKLKYLAAAAPVAAPVSFRQIFVQDNIKNRGTLTFNEINLNQTVEALKNDVAARLGIPVAGINLIYQGSIMQNSRKLWEYNVQNEGTIQANQSPAALAPLGQLFVKNIGSDNRIVTFNFIPSDTVVQLRAAIIKNIIDNEGKNLNQDEKKNLKDKLKFKLLYASRELKKNDTLAAAGIKNESTIEFRPSIFK